MMRVINQVLEFSNVYNQDVLVVTSSSMGYGSETEITEGTKESFIQEMNDYLDDPTIEEDCEDENEFFTIYAKSLLENDDVRIHSVIIFRDRMIFRLDLEDLYKD